MEAVYASQAEYLADILELSTMRLSRFSEEPVSEDAVRSMDRQIREKCGRTVDYGGGVGLEYLFRVFGLTEFERHCVMLALAAELSAECARQIAAAQNGVTLPMLQLCLASFAARQEEQMELLSDWRQNRDRLGYFFDRGLTPDAEETDLSAVLKLSGQIVTFALDYTAEDPALAPAGGLCWPDQAEELVLRQKQLLQMEQYEKNNTGRLLFYLWGQPGSGRRTLIRRFCAEERRVLVWVDLGILLNQKEDWKTLLRPYFREAVIRSAAMAFYGFERLQEQQAEGAAHIRILLEEGARRTDMIFLCSDRPWQPETLCPLWQRAELQLGMPDTAERQTLWEAVLRSRRTEQSDAAARLSNKFALLPGQIAAAAEKAEQLRLWEGTERITDGQLHRACQDQLSSSIGTLATRVNAAYG